MPIDVQLPAEMERAGFSAPAFLPSGDKVLLVVNAEGALVQDQPLGLLDLATGGLEVIVQEAGSPIVARSGHLLYGTEQQIWAVALDLDTGEVIGDPAVVIANMPSPSGLDDWHYSVSDNGTLAYLPGGPDAEVELLWVDRSGVTTPTGMPRRNYQFVRVSADASTLSATITDATSDLWNYDLGSQTLSRLTRDTLFFGVWHPSGDRVALGALDGPNLGKLLMLDLDTSDEPRELLQVEGLAAVTGFTPDGSELIFYDIQGRRPRRLCAAPRGGRAAAPRPD